MENKIKISLALSIRNEGKKLREFFEHIKNYVDDIVICDGMSTDNTVQICHEYGARVFKTRYFGYEEPDRMFVVRQAKYDWVINMDPDERFSGILLQNLNNIIKTANEKKCDGISFPVRIYFDGYEIESMKNRKQIRIIKKGTKASTRMHTNFMCHNILQTNTPIYHYKNFNESLKINNFRIKLGIATSIKKYMRKQNKELKNDIIKELSETKKYNDSFIFDLINFPKFLQIETTTVCNAKCITCPQTKIKRNAFMKEETFKKIRPGLNYDSVIKNINRFLELKKQSKSKILTCASLTICKTNENEAEDFRKYWKNKTDLVDTHHCTGRGGKGKESDIFDDNYHIEQKIIPCTILFETIIINSDGIATMCCEDWKPENKLGCVEKESIQKIWNSDKYNIIRIKHLKRLKYLVKRCKNCKVLL